MEVPSTRSKLLHRKDLARLSEQMRTEGRRLVLTNGCFDLLHVGHVRYLQQARALGDALAVGLNSDRSVRLLKGPGRPLTPEAERAEILAALECVNYVTVFDEERATSLVEEIRPAVYVKGGDYSQNPTDAAFPVEGPAVLEYGGMVRVVDHVPGRSTTEILHRLSGDRAEPV